MSIKNVSFVGLGVMGYPMAGHLQKNGLKNMVVRWERLQMKHV